MDKTKKTILKNCISKICDFVRSLWGEFKSTFDFCQCFVGISFDSILSYFTRDQLVSYFSVITLFS